MNIECNEGDFGLPIDPEESIQIPNQKMATKNNLLTLPLRSVRPSVKKTTKKNDTIFDTRFFGTENTKLQKKLFNIKNFFY